MSAPFESLKIQAVSTFLSKGRRPAQEDFALAERQKGVFVVADGFGGPVPGSQASKNACEAVRNFLFKQAGDLDATLPFVLRQYFSLAGNVLFNSLIYANRAVNKLNRDKNINERGGASAIAAFIDGDLLAVANVGVCSGWIFRDGKALEIVTPRGFDRLCDPFRSVSETESELLELRKAPLMALGMAEDLEPEIFEYRLSPRDWVLLGTDGISAQARLALLQVHKSQLHSADPEKSIQESTDLLSNFVYNDNVAISLAIV